MRKRCTQGVLVVAVLATMQIGLQATDQGEPTVRTLLAGLVQARGGAEAWSKVHAVKIEGTWSMFSEYAPMTILRAQPDRYRLDVDILGAPTTVIYDGEKAWVRSAAFEAPEAQELTESWKRNVLEDAPFGSLLLWYAARDVPIELLGRESVEGQDCYALRVRPENAPEETWYLDAQTHLEIKRVSRTYDVFSGPDLEAEMETFYMDYRDIGGIRWPHREERHFSTRYNVLELNSIEINPELDPAVFRIVPTEISAPESPADPPR